MSRCTSRRACLLEHVVHLLVVLGVFRPVHLGQAQPTQGPGRPVPPRPNHAANAARPRWERSGGQLCGVFFGFSDESTAWTKKSNSFERSSSRGLHSAQGNGFLITLKRVFRAKWELTRLWSTHRFCFSIAALPNRSSRCAPPPSLRIASPGSDAIRCTPHRAAGGVCNKTLAPPRPGTTPGPCPPGSTCPFHSPIQEHFCARQRKRVSRATLRPRLQPPSKESPGQRLNKKGQTFLSLPPVFVQTLLSAAT